MNGLLGADVPLRNYSVTYLQTHRHFENN